MLAPMTSLRALFLAVPLLVSGCLDREGTCDGDTDAGTDAAVVERDSGPPRECRHPVPAVTEDDVAVLVFSRTLGFRHPSIGPAIGALTAVAATEGLAITHTEDPATFTDEGLAPFDVVLFLNTTGDVLDDAQQGAFERWVRAGGGYVGVHSAADTEYDWPWYGELVGAYFRNHPLLPVEVEVTTEDLCHVATNHLDDVFTFTDEIYNFDRNPRRDHHVLLTVDEAGFIYPNTDGGPNMGGDHPVAWLKEFDGGRSFYTNLGHRIETWSDPLFMEHLIGGIRWAASPVQYSRIVVTREVRNPMMLAVAPDGRVFVVERTGEVSIWSPETGRTTLALRLPASTAWENGLLGIALDPDFEANGYVYLYWASDAEPTNFLSRFTMAADGTLDAASRTDLLGVPSERECCHEGGSLAFAPDGTLFVATGDNTNPHESGGHAPIDGRAGRELFDARRTAANPMDLRGKILRVNADGSIPEGNLFDPSGTEGRPEIYTMGNRNPFRITVDAQTGHLYWGEVGPDAPFDSRLGPRGYDEINVATEPGDFGWPFCIADNQPYREYDFETEMYGELFDCTGRQPALLFYDYFTVTHLALGDATDPEAVPSPGTGELRLTGRTAIAGDFYRVPPGDAPYALPDPWRDTLLMSDWTRDRVASVEVGERGELIEVLRFLPWIDFRRPIDMATGPDGALYVLEYGTSYFGDNEDARVSRIEFREDGSLPPVASIDATPRAGGAPLVVSFSAEGSRAPGAGDAIESYEWDLDGDGTVDATGAAVSHTYESNGVYQPSVVAIGTSGRRSLPVSLPIVVGNTPPVVRITMPADEAVVPNGSLVTLEGAVTDAEDGAVPCERFLWDIRLGHNAHTHPLAIVEGCDASFDARLPADEAGTHFFAIELTYRDQGGPSGEPPLTGRHGITVYVGE